MSAKGNPSSRAVVCAAAIVLGVYMVECARAQQVYPTPAPHDETGFEPIFDEKSLDGWEGDPKYWRVENGSLIGEVTPETLLNRNTFIIWRGGKPDDFELKVDFRVTKGGNSGINYRSEEIDGVPFALRGYQCDIDGAKKYTGQNYEEKGRMFLTQRGDASRADADGIVRIFGSVGDRDELAKLIKDDDWNEIHLIVRGNSMTHLVNGRVMCVVVDDDPKHRKFDGLLGVQVHVGPPMKIEYRNSRLKKLPSALAPGEPKSP
jgi:3-keto-disaccharide hydrolase